MPINLTKPIEELQAEALVRIDALAGQTREKYITSVPGQDATYLAKLEDAKNYITAGYPSDSTPYPWIHAEAQAVGVTAQIAADFIVYTASQWAVVGSTIEGARQAAKRGIALATTAETIYNIELQYKGVLSQL